MKVYEGIVKYRDTGIRVHGHSLDTPERAYSYMAEAFDERPFQEQIWVIALNRKHRALGRFLLSIGTLNSALLQPDILFRPLILSGAAIFILAHNHPSGIPEVSSADHEVTRKMAQASEIMKMEFLDHIVCGTKTDDPKGLGYFSFRSAGLLPGACDFEQQCAEPLRKRRSPRTVECVQMSIFSEAANL
jgi:DNA repair protein RadC